MQYKPETEKVAAMAVPCTPVVTNLLSPAEDPQIRHTRKILLIILGVFLALSVAALVIASFRSGHKDQDENTGRYAQIGRALGSILFYGFGLLVVYKYSGTGLRVFAWLVVVGLVFIGIAIALLLIIGIARWIFVILADDNQNKVVMVAETIGFSFYTGIYITTSVILSIIITKLAFKLARLIDANKHFIVRQI